MEILRANPGKKILVVSHKATIRLLLSSLLGFDPRRYRDNLDQSPAALNIVDFKDLTRARLTLFNDISHYVDGAIPAAPQARLSKWWSDVHEAI
jgi:probable phosphoglycerate mutase